MAEITQVQAGTTVSDFIDTLNDNFDNLNSDNSKKQTKIYILKEGETVTTVKDESITVAGGIPTGGSPGDIVIVYEQQQG